MSGKTSYAILLSFMALFAALAAHAKPKELASSEKGRVMAAVRSGNADGLAKALEDYDRRLTQELAPKPKPKKKTVVAKLDYREKKKIAKRAEKIAKIEKNPPVVAKVSVAKVETKVIPAPVAPAKEATSAAVDIQLAGLYQACLKSRAKECCEPMIDKRAVMPESCATRALASEAGKTSNDPTIASDAGEPKIINPFEPIPGESDSSGAAKAM